MPSIKDQKRDQPLYDNALRKVEYWSRASLDDNDMPNLEKEWLDKASKWAVIAIALKPDKS